LIPTLDAENGKWLESIFKTALRFNEPLASYTRFRIGGPADILVEPETLSQIKELIRWCRQQTIPYWVMGGGSNLLITDQGVRGVTIRLNRLINPLEWSRDGDRIRVTAASGIPTKRLCSMALRHGWQGMNFALGIPGLLGGAICMNAGTADGEMADVLQSVTVLSARGDIVNLARQKIGFAYRRATLPGELAGKVDNPAVVLQAEIGLTVGDPPALRNKARKALRDRATKQPIWESSAGSFFKNPSPDTSAGRLIDEAGLKGASVGDACVSEQHANFIVNRGHATAADVLQLKALIEETIENRFGIRLQPEVRIVGQIQNA
jgi:UDP-N-acetylmuramate dehydrogenase